MFKGLKNYIKKQKEALASVSQQDVIALAQETAGQLTASVLASKTPLSITQARIKLGTLANQGVFKTKYDYRENITVYHLKKPELFGEIKKSKRKKSVKDAAVIKLALETQGRLTPALLCLKTEMPIDQAEAYLRQLQKKGVFDLEVDNDGAIIYLLKEYDTLKNLMK